MLEVFDLPSSLPAEEKHCGMVWGDGSGFLDTWLEILNGEGRRCYMLVSLGGWLVSQGHNAPTFKSPKNWLAIRLTGASNNEWYGLLSPGAPKVSRRG